MKTKLIHFAVGIASTILSSTVLSSPTLTYSTYLGGPNTDIGGGIAVDADGFVYVVGGAGSSFPVVNPFQANNASAASGEGDPFVTKFAPDGSVVYSTYLGGSGGFNENGYAIAADTNGNAYIAGTASMDTIGTARFPTYPGTQSVRGATDAFVAKFDSAGNLVYSTLIGGSGPDTALGIAVDGAGSAYVCGWTASTDFPTTPGAAQSVFGGFGALGTIHGIGDGFVAKLNPAGTALEYATFLGGEDEDLAQGIAVDATGHAFVTGQTVSMNFPTNAGAYQPENRGQEDFFVTKVNPSGTAWMYSTYLGGSGRETIEGLHSTPRGIAIDSAGNAYTAGATTSDNYPTTANAIQPTSRANPSSCVTKLNASGSALIYSTFLGCNNRSFAHDIAVDSAGEAYICGRTSDRFPTLNALYPSYGLGDGLNINGYLARIAADGSKLVYSTYLATLDASANLIARGVAVDVNGTAYVTGNVSFEDFVTTANAFQPDFGGASPDAPIFGDAFVLVLASETEPMATTPTITCPNNIVVNATAGQCSAVVNYSVSAASPNTHCVEVACVPPSGSAFPVGTTTVNCVAKDAVGATATCSFTVTVQNPSPTVAITSPASGAIYPISTAVTFTGTFADNAGDVHTAQWAFESATQSGTVNEAAGTVSATQTFTAAGVYSVSLAVADSCGNTASADTVGGLPALVVIYDPNGGFVTGGGWFNSPAGAYVANPTLTGKASFGFVSKYQKGATVPTGETEFQFQVANFNFHSTSYDWLVVAGARAQYKGSGTINGTGNYGFILTAIDSGVKGGGADKFRIKLWDKTSGGSVYDNQLGDSDNADPSTDIGGGTIVIKK